MMRTTVNLDATLLQEAKKRAADSGRSLSSFVADAVRESLARRIAGERDDSEVKLPTVRGVLLPEINYNSFAELNDLAESRD